MSTTITCIAPGCDTEIERGARGPHAVYCSPRCRTRAHRSRTGNTPASPELLATDIGRDWIAANLAIGAYDAEQLSARLDTALADALDDLNTIDVERNEELLDAAMAHVVTRSRRNLEWQKLIYAEHRDEVEGLEQLRAAEARELSALHEAAMTFRTQIREAIDAELRTAPPGQLGADRDQ